MSYCVTLYENIEYKGNTKKFCGEVPNFRKIGQNIKLSSVKVPTGVKVDLYWNEDFKGKRLTLDKDTSNFAKLGLNVKPSSAKVYKTKTPRQLDPVPYTYTIINTQTSKCLSVSRDSDQQGAQITLWQCQEGKEQFWNIKYNIQNRGILTAEHSQMVLSVEKSSKSNNANIIQLPNKNQRNQLFAIKKRKGGFYYIINVNSRLCLSAPKNGTQNDSKIEQVNIINITNILRLNVKVKLVKDGYLKRNPQIQDLNPLKNYMKPNTL